MKSDIDGYVKEHFGSAEKTFETPERPTKEVPKT
jgi:hypothetical protein